MLINECIHQIYLLSIAIKSADAINPHDFESFSRSETNVALVFCVQMWTNSTERILLDSIICANLDGKIVHIQLILSVSVNFAEKKTFTQPFHPPRACCCLSRILVLSRSRSIELEFLSTNLLKIQSE